MTAPVVILTAMHEEAAPFLSSTDQTPTEALTTPLAEATAVRRTIAGADCIIVTTGIGLVAAAAAATWAITTFAPRAVISAGSAGGLAPASRVGDVAIGLDYTYGTADATEFGYERGQVPGKPLRFHAHPELLAALGVADDAHGTRRETDGQAQLIGRILSSDSFITARNVARMRDDFPDAVAADMESGAIAQVCASLGVPFVSVRGVSDLCGPEAGVEFHLGVAGAAARSCAVVCDLLPNLPPRLRR